MITIFSTEQPPSASRLSLFSVSLLLHSAVVCVVVLGIHYSHGFARQTPRHRLVQLIHLQPLERALPRMAVLNSPAIRVLLRGATTAQRSFQVPRPRHARTAKQTLVPLDASPDTVLPAEIPVPTVLLWTQNILPPSRWITPPKPIETQNIPNRPSLALPNSESMLAEINMSRGAVLHSPVLPLPASVTAPVRVNSPVQRNQLPQTMPPDSHPSTAAHVLSISDLPLRAESVIVIPPVAQFAPEKPGTGENGAPADLNARGESHPDSAPPQTQASTAATPTGTPPANAAPGSSTTAVSTENPTTTRIELPKDGRFGAVVVGSSTSSGYPESAGVLTGRVIYTVYLRVGLHKNWILQYCLPKDSDSAGSTIEAPWAFVLLRPNDLAASDSDYIIVHGSINSAGRFEQLTLVYPGELPEQDHLLGALRQWTFRPASRGGQPVMVEALLVIPREGE